MKFIDSTGKETEYLGSFNEVDKLLYPFKEIVTKKDLTGLSLVLDTPLSGEEVFQLQVNVKNSGTVIFLFKKEGFDKEAVINDVSPLKEMSSKNKESTAKKIAALFDIMNKYSPLLSIYSPVGKCLLSKDEYLPLTKGLLSFYLIEVKKENSPEEKKEKTSFKFENPFRIIANDRFHFLFALVASFLISFTVAISIYDMYLGKLIYIFFLVCTLAGMVLNAFIYYDTIHSHKIKDMYSIVTAVSSLAGFGAGIGGYAIFKALSKEIPKEQPQMWMIILFMLLAIVVSAFASLLIKFIKKKKQGN